MSENYLGAKQSLKYLWGCLHLLEGGSVLPVTRYHFWENKALEGFSAWGLDELLWFCWHQRGRDASISQDISKFFYLGNTKLVAPKNSNFVVLFVLFCFLNGFVANCVFKSRTRRIQELETMSVEGTGRVRRCPWANPEQIFCRILWMGSAWCCFCL